MRKPFLLSLLVALLTSLSTHAYDFQSGDLYYNITSNTTVEVTYQKWNSLTNYQGLTTATIPETVTYNGTTYSVTSIEDYAFSSCSSLTSVTIPNSVTSIGYRAFYDCSSLTSVVWNAKNCAGWSSSSSAPFYDICANITSFTFGEEVETIPSYLCYGMSSLTSVTIPDSVTSIGERAFSGCSSLTSVIWNVKNCAGWNSASYAPFYDICANITSFTFGEEVETIPSGLCDGMSSLTSITLPNSITSIGAKAFYGCSSLTTITIPNSVTSIGVWAFYGCTSLPVVDNLRYADTYLVEAVDKSLSTYTIKEGTKWIGRGAFEDCSALTSITIGNSVTSIGDGAFWHCSSLTSLTIPNSVTSIGYYAFQGCSSLTSITIPNSVTSIEDNEFNGCSSLTSITIPNSVTSIGAYAFSSCSSLTSITIGNSVTSIRGRAFADCSSLTSITLPDSVTSIGEYAFDGCSSLTSVVWNAKNCAGWSYPSYAPFYDSRANITSFTFGEEVETIPSYLCDGMSSLTSITLPNSVTSIGSSAFDDCSSLTKTNYTGDLASWCAISFSGEYSNPTRYSHNLYINDVEVKGLVTFPETVTSIGDNAFSGCTSIISLNIPNSVTSIGKYAFYNCSSLADIYCYATTPPVCDGITYYGSFVGVSKHCYIHVPAGTIRDYQMADGWRDFYHFYEISELPDGAPTDQVGVTVTGNYATFSWPVNPTASSYTLTITKDGEVFCTLIFNNMGQLVGMAFAPARNGEQSANQDDAQSTAYGFSFVVTNLDANSHYTYTFTVNGADNEVIETYSGAFDTSEVTALSETEQENKPSRKILRSGQVLILRNGETYDMMGQLM